MTIKKLKLINREISWLSFNDRVLQEATDPDTPLIEKLRFLGIYSNNLDEFFRVRVATLRRMKEVRKKLISETDANPEKTLKEINRINKEKQKEFQLIYQDLLEELAKNNIFIINNNDLNVSQGNFVYNYFIENVRSKVFPIMLDNLENVMLDDRSFYLAVILQVKDKPAARNYALIEVPVGRLSRFLILPEEDGKKYIILLDDVIRYCLGDIFSFLGYNTFRAYSVKFIRDSELSIDADVSKSFLEIMTESLKQREVGLPVRFTYDSRMPGIMLNQLLNKLNLTKFDTIIPGHRYHNFSDFMKFPSLDLPQLSFSPVPVLIHPAFLLKESMFAHIRRQDIMLHYPYQSFQHIIDLLREASIDPKVRAIKMTLYRLAADSVVVNALINAARNGKTVTIFLEVQARFDEEANISWTEKLQSEGVHVIRSIPGFKVHAKLLLIRRKEQESKNVYYAAISTGNFNETTARLYSDTTLFTANKQIAEEVNKVFHLFDSRYSVQRFKHLVVSPFHMRNSFIRLINNEIKAAKKQKEAWIILKLNSLVDEKIVKKLYQAGQAGVKIQLIIRGICVLITGIKGLSDNIQTISIVDRYLEHSRIFVFNNEGDNLYFISSADWMIRNFDFRIEVACPVYSPPIQEELRKLLDIELADNCKARYLDEPCLNSYKTRPAGAGKIRSQDDIYKYLRDKLL